MYKINLITDLWKKIDLLRWGKLLVEWRRVRIILFVDKKLKNFASVALARGRKMEQASSKVFHRRAGVSSPHEIRDPQPTVLRSSSMLSLTGWLSLSLSLQIRTTSSSLFLLPCHGRVLPGLLAAAVAFHCLLWLA